MTQEQKDLLLKDLCARLPYEVKLKNLTKADFDIEATVKLYSINLESYCTIRFYTYEGKVLTVCEESRLFRPGYFLRYKPYLFPLSSMTEEQRIELYKVLGLGYESHYHLSKEWEDFNDSIDNNGLFLPASWVSDLNKMYNWLNKNHFDYQGLIEKGLAIDATDKNIY